MQWWNYVFGIHLRSLALLFTYGMKCDDFACQVVDWVENQDKETRKGRTVGRVNDMHSSFVLLVGLPIRTLKLKYLCSFQFL